MFFIRDYALDILDRKGQKQGKVFLKVKFTKGENKPPQPELVISIIKAELVNEFSQISGRIGGMKIKKI